jgi:hypothetical protein
VKSVVERAGGDVPADLADRLLKAIGPAKAMEILTEAIGGKGKVRQLVNATKARGYSPGRPTEYFVEDVQVLYTVKGLEHMCRRLGVKMSKRRLIAAAIFLQELADGKRLGKGSRDSTIRRIRRHPSEIGTMFRKDVPEQDKDVPEQDRVSFRELHEYWASRLPPDMLEDSLKKDPSLIEISADAILFCLQKNFERILTNLFADEKP